MSLPTVDDLKAHLTQGNSTAVGVPDAELSEFLDAAVGVVEGVVGPMTSAPVTETHYGLHSDVLVLRQVPALALTSVSGRLYPGMAVAPYALTDYSLDPETGVVRLVTGLRFAGDLTVSYSVGRTTIPADLRLAILIVAAQLVETQRVPGLRGGFSQQPAGPVVPMGFAIPNRAAELMAPHRVVRMA